MNLDNRTILQKADLAVADLTSGAGILVTAQAQKFIRLLINEAVMLPMCTVVPMRSPKQLIEKIKFGSRVLRAGQEATPLAQADRAKPDLSKVELDANLFKAEVRLSNETLEDSIERDQLKQTIMQLMGERISTDMEEVIVNGDTTSNDPFLAQLDGILKQAVSNIVNAGTIKIYKGILRDMLKAMPHQYLRNKKVLRYFTSIDAELDYRDSLAERATAVGDRFLEGDAPVVYGGVPLIDVPLFPENQGGGTNCTSIVLTDPKNIQVGIYREIRVETDKDISEGVVKIVATLRFDCKFAEEPAVVKATNVRVTS